MTARPPQTNRAHNFRIVGTIRNETEILNLDWQPVETAGGSRLRRSAPSPYLRFQSGEVYRYFIFPAEQYREFLDADSQGRYFLSHIRNYFPYQRLPRR